jgi:hypothetical protein
VRLAGRIIGLIGCALFVVAMFLPYFPRQDYGGGQAFGGTFWESSKRQDVVLVVAVGIVAVLLLISFFTAPRVLGVIAALVSGFVFGEAAFVDAFDYDPYKVGFYLLGAGGLLMAIGSLLVALPGDAAAVRRATGYPPAPGPVPPTPAPSAGPPPGWYAEPSGRPGERYWSGTDWTDHTR